ncbi:MAG TPA: hypothetical protein VMU66_07400 [Gaiellales bacterium]|nr:hypothetical protein [Gaiellales bacterium]HVB44457.1 hypothetical protein [Streptosporangiaceae bacterium]
MPPIKLAIAAAMATLLVAGCSSSHKNAAVLTPAAPPVTAPASSAPASTQAPAAAGLSGTWSGKYSGAYNGTFTLTWRQSGSNLRGTIKISSPADTLGINGTVTGGSIRFGTVGSTAITYSGSVSGNSMSGTYQVQTGNGSVGGPWSAAKAS